MQHGVAAPWAPGLGHLFGLFRSDAAEVVADGDVFFRKSIGPAEGAHGDVVRGPLADAGDFGEAFDGGFRTVVMAAIEGERAVHVRLGEGDDAAATRADDAVAGDLIDIGFGEVCG